MVPNSPAAPIFKQGARQRSLFAGLVLFFFVFLLAACSLPAPRLPAPSAHDPLFIPPTTLPSPTPALSAPSGDLSNPAGCVNDLKYIQDVTIADGTAVKPKARLIKTWLVQNTGSCNWGQGYSIRLVAGSGMSQADDQPLYPARSGARVEITMELIAPEHVGRTSSAWQAVDPAGNLFGEPITIEINVSKSAP